VVSGEKGRMCAFAGKTTLPLSRNPGVLLSIVEYRFIAGMGRKEVGRRRNWYGMRAKGLRAGIGGARIGAEEIIGVELLSIEAKEEGVGGARGP
jgi:hypothetical protein